MQEQGSAEMVYAQLNKTFQWQHFRAAIKRDLSSVENLMEIDSCQFWDRVTGRLDSYAQLSKMFQAYCFNSLHPGTESGSEQ